LTRDIFASGGDAEQSQIADPGEGQAVCDMPFERSLAAVERFTHLLICQKTFEQRLLFRRQ
jgi:hypothetical protein